MCENWAERRVVSYQAETPFDNIDSSHEYVAMLADAIEEAKQEVESEIAAAEQVNAERRKEALLLVQYAPDGRRRISGHETRLTRLTLSVPAARCYTAARRIRV